MLVLKLGISLVSSDASEKATRLDVGVDWQPA